MGRDGCKNLSCSIKLCGMKPPNEVFHKASLFKRYWETKYIGEEYFLLGEVFKWAKELVGIEDVVIEERLKIYLKQEWHGDETRRHSIAAFVKHFNSFVPKTRRRDGTWQPQEPMPMKEVQKLFEPIANQLASVQKSSDPNSKYECPNCHNTHSPNYKC